MLCVYSSVYAESRVLPPVVDNSTYRNQATQSSAAPSANAMYEVIGRLEQLQAEVQQLRGTVEEQSQMISDLKQRQGNIYSDLDQRLQELAGSDVTVGENALAAANNRKGPSDLYSSGSDLATEKRTQPGNNSVVIKEEVKVTDVVAKTPLKNQKELYQAAYETLRNGHNTRAILAFKSLLLEFPNGEYADNAQYWLAEAYKVNQDLNSAKVAFTKVVTQYADSPKVPDALLKLGYIELELDNMAKARDYLTQVTVNYPKTTAAHLATKKLMQIGAL